MKDTKHKDMTKTHSGGARMHSKRERERHPQRDTDWGNTDDTTDSHRRPTKGQKDLTHKKT